MPPMSPFATRACALAAVSLSALAGCALPPQDGGAAEPFGILREMRSPAIPRFLSGLSWAGGNRFYAVADRGGLLYRLRIDLADGQVETLHVGRPVALEGARDLEGVAWDPLRKTVWAADEIGPSVREFEPKTGRRLSSLALPPVFANCRAGRAIESLAISPDGLGMYLANEEALAGDGPLSGTGRGTRVRLCRFARSRADDDWRADGMWAYDVEPPDGEALGDYPASALVGLMVAEDGAVFALERDLSARNPPGFKARIYQVDFSPADDVASSRSLETAAVRPVGKRLVFAAPTGLAMYEGSCFGPVVGDRRLVALCADGDDRLLRAVCFLLAAR